MTFSASQITGLADEIETKFEVALDHEREQRVLAVVKESVEKLAKELGGYLAVSVNGHVNDFEGGVGDNLNIQLNSLLPPAKPVQDAGLEAAGGSARNFPPESSTAAPATEDNSPPAAQDPVPQSIEAVPPTVEDPSIEPELVAEPVTEQSSGADISTPAEEPSLSTEAQSPTDVPDVPVPPTQDETSSPSSPDTGITDIAA